jgi:hypothetical protein
MGQSNTPSLDKVADGGAWKNHPQPEDRAMKSLIVVVERKQFVLALRENHRGRYLRITEENNGRFNTVVIPADDHEALSKFVGALETLRTLAAS